MLHVWEPVFLFAPYGSRVQNQVLRLDVKPLFPVEPSPQPK